MRSQPVAAPVTSTVTAVRTTTATVTVTETPTSAEAATFDLTGTFTLTDASLDESCQGSGGYHDIQSGTAVTVYNQAGAVDATGSLAAGRYKAATNSCEYSVDVVGVPDDSKFYQVEVSHRGKITVSAMEAKSGAFGGTLGNA